MSAVVALASFVAVALLQVANQPKRLDGVREKATDILDAAVDENPIRRRACVERLVALGPEAVPAIADGLVRGNKNAARTAAIALGEIADEPAGVELTKFFTEKRKRGEDVDLAVVASFALGACPGNGATSTLMSLVEDRGEPDQVRSAAAVALARRSDRPVARVTALFQKFIRAQDTDPEVFAGLVLTVARHDAALAASKLPGILKEARDPVSRAACWIALALVKKQGSPGAAASDFKLGETVLSRAAILGIGDLPRRGDSSPQELREARVVAVGLGGGTVDLLGIAGAESENDVRAAWYGAAAERGWGSFLVRPPWNEKVKGENGRFAAAALLADRNGFKEDEKASLVAEARERWKADPATADAAALVLAALGDAESEALLAPTPTEQDRRPAVARLALKHLRGELDKRRFEQALQSHALTERVLPQGWLSDATLRLASTILGHGSIYFQKQTKLNVGAKSMLPEGMSRRKRSVASDHQMYADLWGQFLAAPFDAMLMFPRNENG